MVASVSSAAPLVVEGLCKAFGGLAALDDMSLEVPRGSITGLIGPNGAGKSTLFNAVSGVLPVDAGRVLLFGEDVTGLRADQIARRGLLRTFQLSRELGRLTVLENLMLADLDRTGERLVDIAFRRGAIRAAERRRFERARELARLVTLTPLLDSPASDLSGGQKKLLELARALMADPEVILLDEPGAGVNPTLMDALAEAIVRLNREHGKTLLVVEHDMNLIARLCDRVVVMAQGRKLVEGSFAEVARDRRVIEAYLGTVAA